MFNQLKKTKSINEWQVAITGPTWKLAILTLLLFWGFAAFAISLIDYIYHALFG